jgi:hypothetical protein
MPVETTTGLRLIADNLDKLADEAADRGQRTRASQLRNNARYVRRAAERNHPQEHAMGAFADKIHAVEKDATTPVRRS